MISNVKINRRLDNWPLPFVAATVWPGGLTCHRGIWWRYHTSSGTNRSIQRQETEEVNDDEGSRDGVKNECADEQSAISPAP